MASSDFHRSSFIRWNYMHAALLFGLFPLIDSLQNHVWSIGPLNWNHFKLKTVSNNHPWVRIFADLALEFVKIICFNHAYNFFFDFTINPLFETFCMNEGAWAFTFTWRNDEIFLLIVITKANLTRPLNLLSSLENSIELTQKDVFQDLFVFAFGKPSDLDNFELDTANFDDISWF